MSQRNKQLAVSAPTGEPIVARIDVTEFEATVRVPKYSIQFTVKKPEYKLAIKKLEKYLEDLILKGMADEDFNPGIGADFDPGRGTPAAKNF